MPDMEQGRNGPVEQGLTMRQTSTSKALEDGCAGRAKFPANTVSTLLMSKNTGPRMNGIGSRMPISAVPPSHFHSATLRTHCVMKKGTRSGAGGVGESSRAGGSIGRQAVQVRQPHVERFDPMTSHYHHYGLALPSAAETYR